MHSGDWTKVTTRSSRPCRTVAYLQASEHGRPIGCTTRADGLRSSRPRHLLKFCIACSMLAYVP